MALRSLPPGAGFKLPRAALAEDRSRERRVKRRIHDREFVKTCFSEHGGEKRLDSVLDKRLGTVLEELGEALWA